MTQPLPPEDFRPIPRTDAEKIAGAIVAATPAASSVVGGLVTVTGDGAWHDVLSAQINCVADNTAIVAQASPTVSGTAAAGKIDFQFVFDLIVGSSPAQSDEFASGKPSAAGPMSVQHYLGGGAGLHTVKLQAKVTPDAGPTDATIAAGCVLRLNEQF